MKGRGERGRGNEKTHTIWLQYSVHRSRSAALLVVGTEVGMMGVIMVEEDEELAP